MDKKKILVIIIIALGLIGITLGVCTAIKNKNNQQEQNIPTTNNDKKLVKEYAGYYGIKLKDSNGEAYSDIDAVKTIIS